jgi:hypothetical protein
VVGGSGAAEPDGGGRVGGARSFGGLVGGCGGDNRWLEECGGRRVRRAERPKWGRRSEEGGCWDVRTTEVLVGLKRV